MEDNATDVFVIKEVLATSGLNLQLHVEKDGYHALRYLRALDEDQSRTLPALVLLDLNLPKVSGLEVLQQLRGNSRFKDIPVIVVTSSNAPIDRAAAVDLGANAYFQKPGDLRSYEKLAELITTFVK